MIFIYVQNYSYQLIFSCCSLHNNPLILDPYWNLFAFPVSSCMGCIKIYLHLLFLTHVLFLALHEYMYNVRLSGICLSAAFPGMGKEGVPEKWLYYDTWT